MLHLFLLANSCLTHLLSHFSAYVAETFLSIEAHCLQASIAQHFNHLCIFLFVFLEYQFTFFRFVLVLSTSTIFTTFSLVLRHYYKLYTDKLFNQNQIRACVCISTIYRCVNATIQMITIAQIAMKENVWNFNVRLEFLSVTARGELNL